MSFLGILYWLLVILCVIGAFAPAPYQIWGGRLALVLFIILGIKVFGLPLS